MPAQPLRTDGSNEFARYSMEVRVPAIADDVLQRATDLPSRARDGIARLRDRIRGNAPLPENLPFPAPDAAFWSEVLAAHAGESWLSSEWFLAECLFYRLIIAESRYLEQRRDPFLAFKEEELASAALWSRVDAALEARHRAGQEPLMELLALALWGNRVDLSYTVAVAHGASWSADDLLVDDRAAVAARLARLEGELHVILDNTGTELAVDLILVDRVLETTRASAVLHVKAYPTFVSDATLDDVWTMLARYRDRGGAAAALARRLQAAFDEERLRIAPDAYWNSPLWLSDRPPHLARMLDGAALVLVKGDANYRRLLWDAIWPEGSSFEAALGYFPASVVCLRTLKSDALIGVSADTSASLDRTAPRWRINGQRGLIQAALR